MNETQSGARRVASPPGPEVESWLWQVLLEEQLDDELRRRTVVSRPGRAAVWFMRVIALVVVALGVLGIRQLVVSYGVVYAVAAVWLLPMVVLGVVFCVEKAFLRISD